MTFIFLGFMQMCSGRVQEFYQNFMLSKLLTIFSLLGNSVQAQSYFPRGLQDQFLAESVCVVFCRILL